jgi:predicted metal-binding membrane protein
VAGWIVLLAGGHASHGAGSHSTDTGATTAMWLLMTAVMMAPTAVPMLATLNGVLGNASKRPWWAFLGAYLAVWACFAVAAAVAQRWLGRWELLSDGGTSASPVLTAGLLAGAGAYQLTSLKDRCLTECVNPMTFLLRWWRDGPLGGLRMGLRHGVSCVGCCWALMLLAFVGGVANVWFMVLSTALMAVEKLPSVARRLTVPLGAALICAAVVVLATASPSSSTSSDLHHATGVVERQSP